jgi:hypothetical protein
MLPLPKANAWAAAVLLDELDACVHDCFFDFLPGAFTTAKLAFCGL